MKCQFITTQKSLGICEVRLHHPQFVEHLMEMSIFLFTFSPGSGKRAQDVWTKRWTRAAESNRIEKRKQAGTENAEMTRRKIGKQGQEIFDKRLLTSPPTIS